MVPLVALDIMVAPVRVNAPEYALLSTVAIVDQLVPSWISTSKSWKLMFSRHSPNISFSSSVFSCDGSTKSAIRARLKGPVSDGERHVVLLVGLIE